jgi:hypothetical protein
MPEEELFKTEEQVTKTETLKRYVTLPIRSNLGRFSW